MTPYASPLKLFEYMALGRAIVASGSPNIREILDHEQDALLFEPGSPTSLAAAICRLAGDAELRIRLGRGAAQKIAARNYTWHGNAVRVTEQIERLSPA